MFRLHDVVEYTQHTQCTYIIRKYNIYLHSKQEKIFYNRFAFLPVSKYNTNKCDICRQWTYIVYLSGDLLLNIINSSVVLEKKPIYQIILKTNHF